MSPVDVVWEPYVPGRCNRGMWDQAIVERLLGGRWQPPGWPAFTHHDTIGTVPAGQGAVVVVPARHHTGTGEVDTLNGMLAAFPWAILILTGDEEHAFPAETVQHPNMRVWVQTPDPARTYPSGTRWLPNGPAPLAYDTPWGERTRDVVLLAQDTHSRRHECADAVQAILDTGRTGRLERTPGFTQGVPPVDYMTMMASALVCPAPSGPVCPDSFRAWEALELGAVPVLDGQTPDTRTAYPYWTTVLGGDHPLTVDSRWDTLPDTVDATVAAWPAPASRAASWWMRYQRHLAHALMDDLRDLGAPIPDSTPDDLITVLAPTSPIPSHPSTRVIEETIDSVRAQLPRAEVMVMCDGPNPTVEGYRQAYEDYLYELVRLCREKWTNVLPIIHGQHLHQSGMTRHALDMVTTPTVLFCEHDTPIRGAIDWPALSAAITSGEAGVIRLHHEARVLECHEHLMLGPVRDVCGAPLRPTQQWSQRPHLASTDLYRQAIRDHFDGRACMVEDVMHGIVQTDTTLGRWDQWRLFVYHPDPDGEHGVRRSWHADGRAGDPKWIGHL